MKGIIFDLDGVIVDTAKYHYLGWKKLADKLGVPFNEEMNEKLKGVGRRDSLIALLGFIPAESKIDEWCNLKNNYYLEYIQTINQNELLPGALALIKEIKLHQDWRQAIASSSKNAKIILQKLKIIDYFNTIIDGTMIEKSKPDPEIFIKTAQKLEMSAKDIVVVEDAESGIEAAKAANMLAIGVGKENILFKADKVVKNLSYLKLDDIEKMF